MVGEVPSIETTWQDMMLAAEVAGYTLGRIDGNVILMPSPGATSGGMDAFVSGLSEEQVCAVAAQMLAIMNRDKARYRTGSMTRFMLNQFPDIPGWSNDANVDAA